MESGVGHANCDSAGGTLQHGIAAKSQSVSPGIATINAVSSNNFRAAQKHVADKIQINLKEVDLYSQLH